MIDSEEELLITEEDDECWQDVLSDYDIEASMTGFFCTLMRGDE